MKTKTKKASAILLIVLLLAGILAILLPQGLSATAMEKAATSQNSVELQQQKCDHNHENDYVEFDIPRNDSNFDINEYVGEIFDFPGIMPLAITVNTTCEGQSSHGVGRENGYSTNFLSTGCVSYRRTGYSYGAADLPFFINTTNMSTAVIDEIRTQSALWNQAVMHDGTGQIVNVYEVNHTNNINGRPVCIVMREDGNYAGQFTGSATAPVIRINQSSRNPDTAMHEFGHYLGLRDTDGLSGVTSGTHKTMMGYSRWLTGGSEGQLNYQDIQGIAIANSNHSHNYMRYVANGSNRTYICFYCDAYSNPTTDVISGSAAMATASSCMHKYQQMVSAGERHWLKCTKCYKVIESGQIMVQGLTSTTLKVTGAIGTISGSLTIPSTLGNQSITEIGTSVFSGQTSLTQVSIPASVTRIGVEAFSPTTVLSNFGGNRANIDFVIAAGTTQTYLNNGWTGFNVVELSASGALSVVSGQIRGSLEIPSIFYNRTITSLGNNAFANQTQLSQISIPSSVTSIGDSAFMNCTNLQNVSLVSGGNLTNTPDHITSYTNYYYTERSLDVYLTAGSTYTLSFDYDFINATTDYTNVFTSLGVGNTTFAVDLPVQKPFSSSIAGQQVITFTPTAAQLATSSKLWCRFIRTSTPQSVSVEISKVRLDVGVANIAVNSFTGCTKLATPGLQYDLLGNNTYEVSKGVANTNTLFIPSTHSGKAVTKVKESGFKDSNFRWVFFQTGLATIGNRAFQYCYNLTTVDMSTTSVTSIEDYTFDVSKINTTYNEFKDISLPEGLLNIGVGAFIRTNMMLNIPNSVKSIGDFAFALGGRLGFGLPDSIETIGAFAFAYSATMLAFVYNGSSLTTIGAGAFEGTLLPTVAQIYPSVRTIDAYAYYNSGFYPNFALPAGSQLTTIGDYAFANNNLTRIVLPSSITNIGVGAFNGNDSLTIYTERSYTSTNPNWNGSNRPIVWGCTLSSDKTYVISFTKSSSNPSFQSAVNGITNPFRKEYSFGGWYTNSDFTGTLYMYMSSIPSNFNGTLYAKWNTPSCIAEGTMITLADGSQVAVEDLTGEELLLVWNLYTGTFDIAPILFIDSDPYTEYEIIHLYFSDGMEVMVISEHGFWDIDLNEYVFLRNDAAEYIGHWFNKQTDDGNGNMSWAAVQLVDVDIYTEYTTAWSPVTFGHLCYYVNGMLSMPGATEGLINIFGVDADTMQYDADAFANDIATYGLFTYEEFAEIIPISEVVFEAFNGQYLKVSIGKGLIDMEGLVSLVERYADFFIEEDINNEHDNGNHNGNGNGNHNGHGNGNHNGHHGKSR